MNSAIHPPTQTPQSDSNSSGKPMSSLAATQNPQIPEDLTAWESQFNIEDVLDEMATIIKRHCILTDEEVDAIVLWIASSFLFNCFNIFPKLALISPEKRCGKSTTMQVVSDMCKDGLQVSNVSPAVLFRITAIFELTLLIDEADTFLKSDNPELVGLINSGHNKSTARVLRCTGDDFKPKVFSTWMPMVLASIGDLPQTIMDRSIAINLKRKKHTEYVQRLPGLLREQLGPIRRKLFTWAMDSSSSALSNYHEPPDIGNDRARDNWLPLFTVSALAGGNWTNRCESAYKAITVKSEPELSTQLLRSIHDLFQETTEDRIASERLIFSLLQDEDAPWSTCRNGGKATPHFIAQLLKPYGISSKAIRLGESTKRGYLKSQFQEAFERYL